MDKKVIYALIGAVVLILIIAVLFIAKPGIFGSKNANMIKLINLYYEKGEYDRALDKLEELLLKNPDNKELLALQDKILNAKNSKEKSKELADKQAQEKMLESMTSALDKNKTQQTIVRNNVQEDKNLDAKQKEKQNVINKLIEDGIKQFNSKSYAKAKEDFQKSLDIDSDNAEANAYLGMTMYEDKPNDVKNVEEAIKKLKKALSKNNNIEQAHMTLAKIYDSQGVNDSAIEEYKETLKLNPNNYEAFYALGRIYYKQKDYKNAEINFSNAVRIKADFINAYYYLGNTDYYLAKPDNAKTYFKKAITLDPKFYNAYFNLGEIYRNENNYKDALTYYTTALKLNNKSSYYLKIGECYKRLNQPDKAVENYLAAVTLSSNNQDKASTVESYENLAELEKSIGKYKDSLSYVDKGLAVSKDSYLLYYISAFSKSKLSDTNGAIADYLHALDINPKDMESYINLSSIYNETGDLDKSISIAQKGIQADGSQYKLFNNLGDSLQKQKNFDQAVVAYKKSIDLNPSSAQTYYNLGVCYKQTKDLESSVKAFQQAISINGKFDDAYYEMGESYFSLNKYKEAKSTFNILLTSNPGYPKREQIDKMLSIIGN